MVLYILFHWSGTPVCSQLVFCMHFCVWGVFLMFPWRCTSHPPTPPPFCSPCTDLAVLIFWNLDCNVQGNIGVEIICSGHHQDGFCNLHAGYRTVFSKSWGWRFLPGLWWSWWLRGRRLLHLTGDSHHPLDMDTAPQETSEDLPLRRIRQMPWCLTPLSGHMAKVTSSKAGSEGSGSHG